MSSIIGTASSEAAAPLLLLLFFSSLFSTSSSFLSFPAFAWRSFSSASWVVEAVVLAKAAAAAAAVAVVVTRASAFASSAANSVGACSAADAAAASAAGVDKGGSGDDDADADAVGKVAGSRMSLKRLFSFVRTTCLSSSKLTPSRLSLFHASCMAKRRKTKKSQISNFPNRGCTRPSFLPAVKVRIAPKINRDDIYIKKQ
jgi:hypothetical protein